MRRTGKKNHTDPFLLTLENLKSLYDFLLKYADTCIFEVVNFSLKGKEVREFDSYEDFLTHKHLIKFKINRLTVRCYKDKREVISLKFNNPIKKILPFISPHTLKTNFSVEGESEYLKFISEYSEIVEKMVSNKRLAYTMLYAFQPSFFAALLGAFYILPVAVLGSEKSHAILFLDFIFLFLLFSMIVNLVFYPFLYIYNPLIHFEFDIEYKKSFIIYFNAIISFLKENSWLLLLAIVLALSVFFYKNGLDLVL